MKTYKSGIVGALFGMAMAFLSLPVFPDDIDLFTSNPGGSANASAPNILFVLDNTSNWSRNDQFFPDPNNPGQTIDQGKAEVQAIQLALAALGAGVASLNVGIMEFPAAGSGTNANGGYIRFAVKPMTPSNLTSLNSILTTIYNNDRDSQHERQNSNLAYGNLMADAYNYFQGGTPIAQSSDVANTGNADSAGYVTNYTKFKAPSGGNCGHNYIIFIGNPNAQGPNNDAATNTTTLSGLGGSTTQPPTALFSTGNVASPLGLSTRCYTQDATGASSCSTTEPTGTYSGLCATYGSCSCDATISNGSTALPTCAAGTQRYSVIGTNTGTATTTTTTTTSTAAGTSACYTVSSAAQSANDHGGLTCPTNTDTGAGSNPRVVTTYSCSYTYGTTGGGSCPATAGTPTTSSATSSAATSTGVSSGGPMAGCYSSAANCTSVPDKDNLTCPAASAQTPATCSSYPCTQTQTTHSCAYSCATAGASCTLATGTQTVTACSNSKANNSTSINPATDTATPACPSNTATRTYSCPGTTNVSSTQTNNGVTCTGNGANAHWPINRVVNYTDTGNKYTVTQTDTPTVVTTSTPAVANFTYPVTQNVTKTVTTTTTPTATTTNLGNTSACYSSQASCVTTDYSSQAGSYNGGLACGNPTTTAGSCPNGGIRYQVQGINQGETPTGTTGNFANKYLPLNADLWTQYMFQNNIASTYAIDVYHSAPNAIESQLYNAMAVLGGGKYFAAQNEAAIVAALQNIFAEIQSVNSDFAAASLPISATNRSQNVNQVYVGMFRPDADANPRWYGNLKRYQLIQGATGTIDLGDASTPPQEAVNSQTGFLADCAKSFWTTDSGSYWQSVIGDKPTPKSACPAAAAAPFSDSPDGPFVEKGSTAEVVRKGNGGTAGVVNRKALTLSGNSFVTFNTANTGLSSSLVNFTVGQDVNDENGNGNVTEPRPSIHGDVIHSRPLPLNYGSGTTPIVVYYGANDGSYRAVDAGTGQELWTFIAPEFFSKLNRLMVNSPKDLLYGGSTGSPKDYFFDGSTGAYQNSDSSKVWIYPSMHRGGRSVYGIDVTTPASPVFKWRAGCTDPTNDSTCVDGQGNAIPEIGQTWSFPNVAQIKGYVVGGINAPVVVMGGGYDACQDANTSTPSCGSAKGNVVYVLDANDGHVIRKFTTTGSAAADVSLIDIDDDKLVDYAYAADLSGNVYRVSFVDSTGAALAPANWTMTRVAYTNGSGRKFLFGPALLGVGGGKNVYLALGSGDREHPLISEYPYPGAVTANGVQNRFYVYLDDLTRTTATNLDDSSVASDAGGATCNTSQLLPGSANSAWYLNLGSGEQTVTSAIIIAGLVAFSTNTPTNPQAGACSNLGTAQGYLVNLFNGSGSIGVTGACGGKISGVFTGGGLPPSPVIATVPVGNTVQTVVLGVVQKNPGAGVSANNSTLQSQPLNPIINAIRKGVFWKRTGDN